jgi:hypothetical protein
VRTTPGRSSSAPWSSRSRGSARSPWPGRRSVARRVRLLYFAARGSKTLRRGRTVETEQQEDDAGGERMMRFCGAEGRRRRRFEKGRVLTGSERWRMETRRGGRRVRRARGGGAGGGLGFGGGTPVCVGAGKMMAAAGEESGGVSVGGWGSGVGSPCRRI